MRLLREPFLHFLLLGAALFALFHLGGRRGATDPATIVVSSGRIEHLTATFVRTWQRPPTAQELQALIDDDVREEVLYREALALGLDRDDTIIRRRLRQKMEFLAESAAAEVEPRDEELQAYLAQHADAYRIPDRFSFRQIYLDPQRHAGRLPAEIDRIRAALANGADGAALGDVSLLPSTFDEVTVADANATFGEAFGARLIDLPVGRWDGPVTSGYGVHLVYVDDRTDGRPATLAEVRDAVRRDWANERRIAAVDAQIRRLMERYRIDVERPDTAGVARATP
ncbi:MAG TPA: peptidylprolyl isomerase [Candidatus Binatia bacterium]|jgi:hypothetical protein|nr:peptidylprolyl isomerase [Candidatus Binatia bacterium]